MAGKPPNFFGATKATVAKSLPPGSAGGGTVPLGPPAPKRPVGKRGHRALLDQTINAVHGGRLTEQQGEQVLRTAGFPDSHNPFALAHQGSVVKAIAGAPRAVVKAAGTALTPHRSGELAAQDLARAQSGQPNAGTVVPGMGLVTQLLYQAGQGATYGPAGAAAVVTDPVGTAKALGHHVTDPNVADAAFLAYIALHGGATAGLRINAAARAPSFRDALTRSSVEGGSLLHTPWARPVPIHIQMQRPTPQPGPDVAVYPKGTVFHGSPEGEVAAPDPTYHTKPWGEGIGFYVTESEQIAGTYAAGRTASGTRKVGAKKVGAVTPFKLKPGTVVLDMNAPADMALWRQIAAHDLPGADFDYYVIRQAKANPTNADIREEILYQMRDMYGSDAVYAIEDGLAAQGIQATTHIEGLRAGTPHRVWVVKDPSAIRQVPKGKIRYVPGPVPEGVAQGPRNAVTFERPVIQNPLVRPFSRARSNRIQKAVNRETAARETGVPVRGKRLGASTEQKLRGTFSPVTTAGRELRAIQRVERDIANAHAQELLRIESKLSAAERDALLVAAIHGEEAFTNPAGTIARHIEKHTHFANIGGDPVRTQEHLASVQATLKVLQDPSERFKKALALARESSERTTNNLISSGSLGEGKTPQERIANGRGVAAGRQAKIADLYGYDAPPPGSFYFPLSDRYQLNLARTGGAEAVPSPFGVGSPSMTQRVGGLSAPLGGSQVLNARFPNVGQALGSREIGVNNALAVRRQFEELWRVGRPAKRSDFDIPVRDPSAISDELRQFFSDLSHQEQPVNPDAVAALAEENMGDLLKILDGGMRNAFERIKPGSVESRMPGVRWVDRRLLAPSRKSANGLTWNIADTITNPIRVTQLYARPAYILNLAGNLGMNGISEGARVFPALKQAATAQRRLPSDVVQWYDGGMGVSLSRAYSVGRGPLGHLSDKMAEFWNRITDMHSRRAAFFAAAAREGFKTDAQIIDLKTNPAHAAARIRIFRQANKNIVDYGSMTPFERDEVRRLIYFYPWVSRGTIWALRTLVEHPYKSFTLFELGQVGAENAHRQLGKNLPDWVEQLGLIPVGHSGDRTKVINPSSVWTPTTAVQAFTAGIDTGKALIGLPHGGSGAGDLLTPFADVAVQASTREQSGANPTGVIGLLQSVPYYQAARRFGWVGSPSQTYPEQGWKPALGPLAIGGFAKRGLSRTATDKQAIQDASSPRAKLAIQLDQAAELGIYTEAEVARLKRGLAKASADEITRFRRALGPALKQAHGR